MYFGVGFRLVSSILLFSSVQTLFQEAGVKVDGFMGNYNPIGGFQAYDIVICTIEKANSLINRMMEEKTLNEIGTFFFRFFFFFLQCVITFHLRALVLG